jgi:hypothetical protein
MQGIGVSPRAYSSAKRSITSLAEAALVVEHVMRDAEPVGDRAGVVDVLAGAAGAPDRRAMVVELQRDADHLGAAARGERGRDRGIDAARHGDDDPAQARACAVSAPAPADPLGEIVLGGPARAEAASAQRGCFNRAEVRRRRNDT